MNPRRPIHNQSGATLIYVLGTVALSSFVLLQTLNVVQSSLDRPGNEMFRHDRMAAIIDQIKTVIGHPASWSRTISANPILSCLATSGAVCPNGAQNFNLLTADGTPLTGGSRGFDRGGYICNRFNAADGDLHCVFQVRLQMNFQCPPAPAPCQSEILPGDSFATLKPGQEILLQIAYQSSADDLTDETAMLGQPLAFMRGEEEGSLRAFCEALGGDLTGGGTICQMRKVTALNCRADRNLHMVGLIDRAGTVHCRNPAFFPNGGTDTTPATLPLECGPRMGMTGVAGDGFTCGPF